MVAMRSCGHQSVCKNSKVPLYMCTYVSACLQVFSELQRWICYDDHGNKTKRGQS